LTKAWVNFNGTTGAVRASYNVGSVTRVATGQYTINFTSALSDANYSAVASTSWGSSANAFTAMFYQGGVQAPTTTSFKIETRGGGSLQDPDYVLITVDR
jgi:hypothetical protein